MIILGRTSKQVCPVTALTQYAAVCPPSTGPLFITTKGKVITKQWFITQIRSILAKIGISQDQYAGHSLRIGAAITAAQNGIEDSTIRQMAEHRVPAIHKDVPRTPCHAGPHPRYGRITGPNCVNYAHGT